MKLPIFLIFMATTCLNAQESNYEIHTIATQIAPEILNFFSLNSDDSLYNNNKAFKDDLIDPREYRKYKQYTIHLPQNAQTLSEFKKTQADKILSISSEAIIENEKRN